KFCTAKTKWFYFQELLKTIIDNFILLKTVDDITRAVKSFNYAVAWSAMPTSSKLDINIECSSAMKEKGSFASYSKLTGAQL
ncbi:hypothetical protein HN011_000913, partial [Eciton burchellii]